MTFLSHFDDDDDNDDEKKIYFSLHLVASEYRVYLINYDILPIFLVCTYVYVCKK